MTTLTREIIFRPAFDKRSADPRKNYGIHGAEMIWYLKSDKGVVQFVVYTNWHLPHVEKELDARVDMEFPHLCCHPQPADVGYHSPTPHYEEQTLQKCDLLPGGKCYYDGSGLRAEELFALLVREGSEAVWKELEQIHNETLK